MPRFTRFVIITSLMLFCLYVFYPDSTDVPSLSSTAETFVPEKPVHPTEYEKNLDTKEQKSKANLVDDTKTTAMIAATFSTDPLRSSLSKLFPYKINSVFPSFIWQTWKNTPADADFPFRAPEATWTEAHPGYIHEVVTDEVAALLIAHLYRDIPDVIEAYEALPKAILKADFFRYLILLARGGIYSDIDTEVILPAWEWVPMELVRDRYGLVIGIEADPDRQDWEQWYSRRIQFCQWTIRSKPGHPALVEIVAMLTEATLERKREGNLLNDGLRSIVEWTGPAIWTDAIFRYLNSPIAAIHGASVDPPLSGNYSWKDLTGMTEARRIGDVIILPITGFSPGQGHMGSQDFDDPHAMVKHDFEGTWKPESERMKEEKTDAVTS